MSQPGAHAADIRGGDGDSDGGKGAGMPNLRRAVEREGVVARFSVAEVVGGTVAAAPLEAHIRSACAGKEGGTKEVRVERVELERLPAVSVREGRDRREVVEDNGTSFPFLISLPCTWSLFVDLGRFGKQIISWAGCLRR